MSFDLSVRRGIFRPPAVTIVGFSEASPTCLNLWDHLHRDECKFTGPIHRINPTRAARGERGYVAAAADVDGPLGFVFIMLNGETAVRALRNLTGDITAVAVYGGGFADVGRDDLEQEIADWSAEHAVPVLGPQSAGVYRFTADIAFCGITGPAPAPAKSGSAAFVSQSGALVGAFLRAAWCKGLGVGCVVSIGNGRGFSFADAATAALAEDDITAVCIYVEGVSRLADLAAVGKEAARRNKIVLLAVGGESAGGQSLAQSHTGALATDSAIVRGVARQYGIVQVANIEELLWAAQAIDRIGTHRLLDAGPNEVALFGLTGGGVIQLADRLERHGIRLVPPTEKVADTLRGLVGDHPLNPLDGGALALVQGDSHATLTNAFARDPQYRFLVCVAGMGLPPPTSNHTHLYDALSTAVSRSGKVGVLISPLPDITSGDWDMEGLVVARGIEEGALKVRVLRDVARLGSAARHSRQRGRTA